MFVYTRISIEATNVYQKKTQQTNKHVHTVNNGQRIGKDKYVPQYQDTGICT